MEEGKMIKNMNMPLTDLKTNEKARITKINTDDLVKLRKLTAFGIMPGFDIMLIQRYPAYVLQIGFTQVALDEGIASEIIVTRV
ncbi:MAG: ferrous iron transport protein A [Clostridia bacterium]|nr:ferrous iron transport protein A [Clostridia bacterium]